MTDQDIDQEAAAFASMAATANGELVLKYIIRDLETPTYQPGADPSAAVYDAGRRAASEHIKHMILKGQRRE